MAGRTSGGQCATIDYLEGGRRQTHENVRDNLFGPIQLAILTQERGIHLTYLGTGCIFNYDAEHRVQDETGGFQEDDLPNFWGSSYSSVKGFTDRLMHFFPHVLNLRIRMPINEDLDCPRNFLAKIISYEKICSIPNSMTVIPDILPIMADMIKKGRVGTVNLTNPGIISHNEILDMYKMIVDPSFTYTNFTIEEQNRILRSERSNNRLDTSILEKEYFILPIYESVQRLLKRIRKQRILTLLPRMTCIMITGGFGFIGSNFIRYMRSEYPNLKIVNVDKVSYCSRREHLVGIDNLVNYEMDINDMPSLLNILREHEIDVVVHFAAQSHVDNSFNNSIQFTQDNIAGTHNLLEACRVYNQLSRFLHVSTDEVYGETIRPEPFTETHLPNPTNPYAATKISAEFLVQSYFHCFDLPIIIVRGNNVYGPRQYPEKLIPRFILLLLNDTRCTIHGNGNTRRNFIYVEDMCHCIRIVLERGGINEIYNIGTDNEHSVKQIANRLISIIRGSHVDPRVYYEFVPDRFYNDFQYRINFDKVKQLGWESRIGFDEGLRRTIAYYSDPDQPFDVLTAR
jgi:dTDP-glucose 4,6-dehydratase/UDP-glucose 4,6-dehydratase